VLRERPTTRRKPSAGSRSLSFERAKLSRDDERRLRRLSNQATYPRWRSDSGRSVTTLPARPRLALSVHQALHCIARATEALANDYPAPPWARRAAHGFAVRAIGGAPRHPVRAGSRFLNAPLGRERVAERKRGPRDQGKGRAAVLSWPGVLLSEAKQGSEDERSESSGGLKGRGGVREPRTYKHRSAARSAGGPRDRSAPRAF